MTAVMILEGAVLYSKDLDRARTFYHDILGLPILLEDPHLIHFDAGSVRIAIQHYPTEGAREAPEGFLMFAVSNLDSAYVDLKGRGAEFLGPPANRPYGRVAYLRDPEGHEIGLIEEPRPGSEGYRRVAPLVDRLSRITEKLDH
jgi:predicted enzyme related to lactoylglutathione lyase